MQLTAESKNRVLPATLSLTAILALTVALIAVFSPRERRAAPSRRSFATSSLRLGWTSCDRGWSPHRRARCKSASR